MNRLSDFRLNFQAHIFVNLPAVNLINFITSDDKENTDSRTVNYNNFFYSVYGFQTCFDKPE